jgi:hypothetical protein
MVMEVESCPVPIIVVPALHFTVVDVDHESVVQGMEEAPWNVVVGVRSTDTNCSPRTVRLGPAVTGMFAGTIAVTAGESKVKDVRIVPTTVDMVSPKFLLSP